MTQALNKNLRPRIAYALLMAAMLAIPAGMMGYKLYVLDYPMADLIPAVSYQVELSMQVDGHGDDIDLGSYLPKSDSRQTILQEQNASGQFVLELQSDNLNRIATWRAQNVTGRQSVRYSYMVQAKHVRYTIPDDIHIDANPPASLRPYLQDEPGLSMDNADINLELLRVVPDREAPLVQILTQIHRHLQDKLTNRNFSGFTDALTALKLGEASCNGKGRLFVAWARKLGIPARLVGGLILQPGSKRTSHQWVEVYIKGHWVPFDTINDHFAELPANFLTLYYGDQNLFKHTSNVNFQYFFKTLKRLVPKQEAQEALGESSLNVLNIYALFERIGISQNLLKILLMIPLGALVVVIFRNVIGLETFGTFLPALIAAAARETGLLWGLIGFALIIVTSAMVRKLLDWMQLLHSPKMAIMLTVVVVFMLLLTIFGVQANLFDLAHITLFPIAILAITSERFAIIHEEQGLKKAMRITGVTAVVIAACYVVMDSLFLQSLIVAFPELLLTVIALNLWLGKWVGMRVTEFYRFRKLIFARGTA